MKNAGITWIRDTLYWQNIEKTAGVYTWPTGFSDRLAYCSSLGIHVMVVLAYGNTLYGMASDGSAYPSTSAQLTAYKNFCVAAVNQYKGTGGINDFEIWNEFDNIFGDGATAALGYDTMLTTVYGPMHSANSSVNVIGGVCCGDGLSTITAMVGQNSSICSYFDTFSAHPYPAIWGDTSPDNSVNSIDVSAKAQAVNSYIKSHNGNVAKPYWITEIGWSVMPSSPLIGNWSLNVSPQEKATYSARVMALAMVPNSGINKVFYYSERDAGSSQFNTNDHTGYSNAKESIVPYAPKLSLLALGTFSSIIDGSTNQGQTNFNNANINAYKYLRTDGSTVYAVYSIDEVVRTASITLSSGNPTNFTLYDMYGNPQSLGVNVVAGTAVNFQVSGNIEYLMLSAGRVDPVDLSNYKISAGNILTNIQLGTSVSDCKNVLAPLSSYSVVLNDVNGHNLIDDKTVGTGTTINVYQGSNLTNTYTVVIYGDVDGDGIINLSDLVDIRNNLLGVATLGAIFQKSGDLYGEGRSTLNDLVGVMASVSNAGTINQNH